MSISPLPDWAVLSSVVGGNTSLIFQSSLFTVTFASDDRLDGCGGLSKEAIHAGQTSVLAGQSGLDVFIRGHLRQVSQSCYCGLTAHHLGGYSLNVTSCHVAWKLFVGKSKNGKNKEHFIRSLDKSLKIIFNTHLLNHTVHVAAFSFLWREPGAQHLQK